MTSRVERIVYQQKTSEAQVSTVQQAGEREQDGTPRAQSFSLELKVGPGRNLCRGLHSGEYPPIMGGSGKEERGIIEITFEGPRAEWAHFSLLKLMGKLPPLEDLRIGSPAGWMLEEDNGFISLVPNPVGGQVEIAVVEIMDRGRQTGGIYTTQKIRIVSHPEVINLIETQVGEAMQTSEGCGIREALRERKFPRGWITGLEWISEEAKR